LWQRRQFPVKKSFATTTNKAQGTMLKMAQNLGILPWPAVCGKFKGQQSLPAEVRSSSQFPGVENVVYNVVLLLEYEMGYMGTT